MNKDLKVKVCGRLNGRINRFIDFYNKERFQYYTGSYFHKDCASFAEVIELILNVHPTGQIDIQNLGVIRDN